jgi:L-lactate dehydrogenase
MQNYKKCGVIGCGNVGATTAYTLMLSGIFNELVLVDIDTVKATGEAEDIAHGIPFNSPSNIYAGNYKDLSDAGIVIITAGVSQRQGETRLDLLQRNTKVFSSIIENLKQTAFDGILLVVTNPVDILTYITIAISGYDSKKVIGSGTVLDTARLKQLMGNELLVDPRNVHTFIIGEHGDSELPVWSSANVSGIDISSFCHKCCDNCNEDTFNQIFEDVRDSAYRIINAKGSTYYAIAEAVRRIVEAIVRDERAILPVSALLEGQYGISGICLGIPCVIGKNGIEEILEIPLNDNEKKQLSRSASTLHTTLGNLGITLTV